MKQTAKQLLVLTAVGVFLLAACAPAPAPTEEAALIQRLSEQSGLLTSVAQTAQVQDRLLTEQATALSAAMATPLPTQAPVSESEPPPTGSDSNNSESGNVEIPAGPGLETPESGDVEIPSGPDSSTPESETGETQDEEVGVFDEDFDLYCGPLLKMQLETGDIEQISLKVVDHAFWRAVQLIAFIFVVLAIRIAALV